MKKIIILLLTITMVMGIMLPVVQADNTQITVTINDQQIQFDQPPIIMDGRTLVPLRAIFEGLGATVDWNGNTQTVTAKRENTTVKITIGDNKLYANENAVNLDVPAQIISDRTLVPVRAVSEAFDCHVNWDGNTRTVSISADISMIESDNEKDYYYVSEIITYRKGTNAKEEKREERKFYYEESENEITGFYEDKPFCKITYEKNGNKIFLLYYDRVNDWEKYTTDENNNIIGYETDSGYSAEYTYDKNGNLLYYETSDGTFEKHTYDENGNEIFYERSDGYWKKTTYSADGNKTYYEDSKGNYEKCTYDKNGNMIHREASDGTVETITYDAGGNKIVEGKSNLWEFGYKSIYDSRGNEIFRDAHGDGVSQYGKSSYDINNKLIYQEDRDGDWVKLLYDDNNNLTYVEDSYGCFVKISYVKLKKKQESGYSKWVENSLNNLLSDTLNY